MDKSKKTAGKKNKTVGSGQSAAKGRDVTDSGTSNARDKTAAAVAASCSVETAHRQKEDIEFNQLKQEKQQLVDQLNQSRQENQELLELKRRQEAELSALRRRDADTTELFKNVNQISDDAGEVPLEQVLSNCVRQRDELLQIKKLSERQSIMLKKLRETVTSGGCARCTFRRSFEDADVSLMTAVQCTEPPGTARSQTRQVLLNDGRQFVLTTASANDCDVSTFPSSNTVSTASHAAGMRVTEDPATRTADDADMPPDLSLRDETQVPAAAAAAAVAMNPAVAPCPFCHLSGFASHMELTLHVNNAHLDNEDVVD